MKYESSTSLVECVPAGCGVLFGWCGWVTRRCSTSRRVLLGCSVSKTLLRSALLCQVRLVRYRPCSAIRSCQSWDASLDGNAAAPMQSGCQPAAALAARDSLMAVRKHPEAESAAP